jgi:hypothetical protein
LYGVMSGFISLTAQSLMSLTFKTKYIPRAHVCILEYTRFENVSLKIITVNIATCQSCQLKFVVSCLNLFFISFLNFFLLVIHKHLNNISFRVMSSNFSVIFDHPIICKTV